MQIIDGIFCNRKLIEQIFIYFSGRIIDGFDALDELEKLPVNPKTYKPLVEKRINSVTIHANPLAA